MDMEDLDAHVSIVRNHSRSSKVRRFLKQNTIMLLTLVGICLGFMVGIGIREFKPSEDALMWIGLPGDLYMRLLKMTILPLVACSVITGASSVDPKTNGKIGGYVITFVIVTNIIACTLATGLVLLIKPGGQSETTTVNKLNKAMKIHDVFADLLRNLMPDNIVSTTFRQSYTKYVLDNKEMQPANGGVGKDMNLGNTSVLSNASLGQVDMKTLTPEYTKVIAFSNGINVLGLITICAVFGVAAGKIRTKVPYFLMFMENALLLILIVVRWFFWLTPIGVLSLIANSVAQVDNVFGTFSDLGLFVMCVTVGILIHWLIILPVIYAVIVRKSPIPYFLGMLSAVSIAFAGTNSSVAMPEMFHICEKNFQMDRRVTRIGIPLATTLNADGSGIFIVCASVFITDYSGIDITSSIIMVILLLAVVSCLAIPGVPSASIFTIIIILTALQVPLQHVAILFAVEWFLDRLRTGLNLVSHMTVVAITHQLSKNILRQLDETGCNGDVPAELKELTADSLE